MKQVLYAMRRANGDWFSMEMGGRTRVPVLQPRGGAAGAR